MSCQFPGCDNEASATYCDECRLSVQGPNPIRTRVRNVLAELRSLPRLWILIVWESPMLFAGGLIGMSLGLAKRDTKTWIAGGMLLGIVILAWLPIVIVLALLDATLFA